VNKLDFGAKNRQYLWSGTR